MTASGSCASSTLAHTLPKLTPTCSGTASWHQSRTRWISRGSRRACPHRPHLVFKLFARGVAAEYYYVPGPRRIQRGRERVDQLRRILGPPASGSQPRDPSRTLCTARASPARGRPAWRTSGRPSHRVSPHHRCAGYPRLLRLDLRIDLRIAVPGVGMGMEYYVYLTSRSLTDFQPLRTAPLCRPRRSSFSIRDVRCLRRPL
jgi:hypothetical protein